MARRDSNDAEWKKTKRIVSKRDKGVCRLMMVVSAGEGLLLKRNSQGMLSVLDPAHYLPVSIRPDLCYDPDNIVLLNRYSHNMLDYSRNPITGGFIDSSETKAWWKRILQGNTKQYKALQDKEIID